ncbi:MAG: flavin reductase family protein [Microbacteriaceae bacterium]
MSGNTAENGPVFDANSVQAFKDAFARHAAGVAIITSRTPDGAPVGFTATSLASLSADPPRATFNIAQTSSSWSAITVGNLVAVHFLGVEAGHIAAKFATDTANRFVGEHWVSGPYDLPIVNGNTAVLIARVSDVILKNNNAIVVLDILEGQFAETHSPLLYYQRTFHALGEIDGDLR